MKNITFSIKADKDNQQWARYESVSARGNATVILPKKDCEYLVSLLFCGRDASELTDVILYEVFPSRAMRPVGSCWTICR